MTWYMTSLRKQISIQNDWFFHDKQQRKQNILGKVFRFISMWIFISDTVYTEWAVTQG